MDARNAVARKIDQTNKTKMLKKFLSFTDFRRKTNNSHFYNTKHLDVPFTMYSLFIDNDSYEKT